jgi:RecJ-like exonuclease
MSLSTPENDSYAPEVCGLCRGNGTNPSAPCPACQGHGTVLVRQPPLSCPRCGGNGMPKTLAMKLIIILRCASFVGAPAG